MAHKSFENMDAARGEQGRRIVPRFDTAGEGTVALVEGV
jgi:hypothetical protein